jgi:PKD domain/CHU_C Type IX secretion signal domain
MKLSFSVCVLWVVLVMAFAPAWAQLTPTPVKLVASLSAKPGPTPSHNKRLVVDITSFYKGPLVGSNNFWTSADFVLQFDTNAIWADSAFIQPGIGQGRWSRTNDARSYKDVTISRGVNRNTFVIRINRNDTGLYPGALLSTAPGTASRIVRFEVPFKKCNSLTAMKWRNTALSQTGNVSSGGTGSQMAQFGIIPNAIEWSVPTDVNGATPAIADTLKAVAKPNGVYYSFDSVPDVYKYKLEIFAGPLPTSRLLAVKYYSYTDFIPSNTITYLYAGTRDSSNAGCSYGRLTVYTKCDSAIYPSRTATIPLLGGCPPPCPAHPIDGLTPQILTSQDSSDLSFCLGSQVTLRLNTPQASFQPDDSASYSFDGGLTYTRDTAKTYIAALPSAGTGDSISITIRARDRFNCYSGTKTLKYRVRVLQNTATVPHITPLDPFYCFGTRIKLVNARKAGEDSIRFRWTKTGTNNFTDANGSILSDTTNANPVYYQTSSVDVGNLSFGVYYNCYNLNAVVRTQINPFPITDFSVKTPNLKHYVGDPHVQDLAEFTVDKFIPNGKGKCLYTWDFGDGSPVIITRFDTVQHIYLTPGQYTARLSAINDDGGCQSSTIKKLNITSFNEVFVPTAFAPDAVTNANNTAVKVYGIGISNSGFSFAVFSRWGELVYQSNDFTDANTQGWNGRKNNTGTELPLGSYTFALKGKYSDGSTFEKTGNVTLIR